MTKARILPLFVPHWGCPNQCVFCDQKRISGSPLPVSAQEVAAALEKAGRRGLTPVELAFYGGSFTAVPTRLQQELLEAVQPYRRAGAVTDIRVSTRPDAVDAACLDRLQRYGVTTVELGAQSMDESVLAASGRGHTGKDTRRASALVKGAGLKLILQMMTGLPGSDGEKDRATARELIRLAPDGVRIYPTVVIRGTVLEQMWRQGAYPEHTVEQAVSLCADLLPLFEAAGIPVIRLGLNPTEDLSGGEAVAGAYHPALGELVRSEVLRRRAAEKLDAVPEGSRVTLHVAPHRLSAMIGWRRSNVTALKEQFALGSLAVKPLACEEGDRLDVTVDPPQPGAKSL